MTRIMVAWLQLRANIGLGDAKQSASDLLYSTSRIIIAGLVLNCSLGLSCRHRPDFCLPENPARLLLVGSLVRNPSKFAVPVSNSYQL